MKRLACMLMVAALLCGCATPALPEAAATTEPTLTTEPAATAEPTPTSAPTPTPTNEPTPTPTPAPKITDAWYAARTAQIRGFMEAFGDYESDAAIDAQLALWEIDPDAPMIALTFDDGPSPGVTDKILDILARYNLRATFFVRGDKVHRGSDLLRRTLSQGCELGNHTQNHRILSKLGGAEIREQIMACNDVVEKETGYRMHIMRAPGGAAGEYVYKIAGQCDMAVVRWSQSGNVNLIDPVKIAATVLHQEVNGKDLRDGDIILLHDTHDFMIEAVEIMIPTLLERGYQFVTVTELLQLSEQGFHYGAFYKCQYPDPVK